MLLCSYLPMNTMVVLYPKYFISSMRCLSCLPLTISLQSLRFLPFALFSSSSAFPSTPSLSVVSDFLTKECGFSSTQVTIVGRNRPSLLRNKSDQTAREVFHMLIDYGFTENMLKSAILRNPTILSLNVDGQLKPKMEFLKNLGLDTQEIRRIIFLRPRLLNLSSENSLGPRIFHLRNIFGSNVHLCQALKMVPDLLTTDFEKQVKPKIAYVKHNIGILEGCTAFLPALYAVCGQRCETLEKKIKNMTSLGLAEEEVFLILRSCPRILRSSTKKIKENMDFLIHTAGLMPKIVASRPILLNYSVEKRLKPRYGVFKYLRTDQQSKSLPSLVTFFTLSEKVFLKDFGQYSTQVKSNDHTIS